MRRSGFSLVELSIVLVILGLLTGGILAGQSLIRAAEIRSVTTEFNRYVTATQTFRDKYFGLPGDFRDATKFWNLQVSGSGCISNSGIATVNAATGSCDGNGDGFVQHHNAAGQTQEAFQYWRQLTLAGLIEGTYSGLAGTLAVNDTVTGTNAPASRLANAGWGINTATAPIDGTSGTDFTGEYGVYYFFGGRGTGTPPWNPAIKPEEAWNIDTKVDDGKPATGKLVAGERPTCTTASAAAAGATDYNASYALSTTTPTCKFYFRKLF